MSTSDERQYPSSAYAWYMVVILTIAYILSFVDRYVFGLLIEPIKADFGLTDLQISMIGSTAFAIFYATMGLPLGYLADRTRRTWMLGVGVLVWSAATVACGLAKNFVQMFMARMAVGAGEATLGPCAMSMISDSFPREKRGKPIAFYSAALSLGAGIASLVSATILVWANSVPELSMPIVGVVKPWQFVFIVVGLPGIFVAALMLTLREPPRQFSKDAAGGQSIGDTLRHFRRHWKVYGCCISFASVMVIVAYSQFFYAPMFQRTWGWEPQTYAVWNGIVLLAIGPASVNFAGYMNDRLYKRGISDAPLLIGIIGVLLIVPTGIVIPLMPSPELAFAVIVLNTIGIATTTATSVTALMNITPSQFRGQTAALYYMIVSMLGLILGPNTVGALSDYVFGNEHLNYAASATVAIYGIPVLFLIGYARRLYQAEHDAQQFKEAPA
ncbi:MAG: MFS transporter [Pseudomonadota bacterium]